MIYTNEKMNVDLLYLVCIHKDGRKSQKVLPKETDINTLVPQMMAQTDITIVNYYYTKDWIHLYNFRWFISHAYEIESLI